MIDFRYHLVSLISVFLALAVGIVLGAGPLNEPIAQGLSESVNRLRQDQATLTDQLRTAQAGIANRDTFISQIEPGLVADQLGGRSVVVITLPGFDADALKPLATAIAASGAKVTGRIDIQNAWVDPNDATARDKAVQALAAGVGALSGPTSSPTASGPTPSPSRSSGFPTSSQATAGELLARAVLTTELSASEKTDATARSLLDGLTRAGLVDVVGDTPTRATQAVVLVPGVAQAVQGAGPSPSPTGSVDPAPAWLALAGVLDSRSTGAVVVGPASAATTGGLLTAVRSDTQLTGTVSTVDTGGTPMGDVTTVYALREQQLGRAGQYGFGDGAKAPLPASAGAG
jgi:Copper transport outer membrane protein, MctB